MKDLGYDITDMLDIDPLFGVMKDFEELLSIAHDMGLKVLIDQVWNHTSQLHPWLWRAPPAVQPQIRLVCLACPRDDGSPPNNWLSAFMGRSAWQWHLGRRQYYLANFLPCQPELNWHNSEVLEAVLDLARFWLDKGVDGFRIDAVNFFLEDPPFAITRSAHRRWDSLTGFRPTTRWSASSSSTVSVAPKCSSSCLPSGLCWMNIPTS